MKKYVKSIIISLVCFLVVFLLNFILPRLLPGDPVAYLTGMDEEELTEEQYEYYRSELHLDENVFKQFGYYLESVFDGTLGYSYKKEAKVSELILGRIGGTLQISLAAVIISSALGLILGLHTGYKRGRIADKIAAPLAVIVNSLPVFVLGMFFIIALCFNVRLFPYSGLNSYGVERGTLEYFLDRLHHLALPVLTLSLAMLPPKFLLARNAAAKETGERYVSFAKQRGLKDGKIIYGYILKNVAQPYVAAVGISVGASVGGSLVVENLFSINGIGTLLTDAVYTLDYPLMQGTLFVVTLTAVIAVIAADIICILIDPKLRKRESKSKLSPRKAALNAQKRALSQNNSEMRICADKQTSIAAQNRAAVCSDNETFLNCAAIENGEAVGTAPTVGSDTAIANSSSIKPAGRKRALIKGSKIPLGRIVPFALGFAVLFIFILIACFPSAFTDYGRKEMFEPWLPASSAHLLGTNDMGYDVFTELVYGTGETLFIGITSSLLSLLIGVVVGVLAAGGKAVGGFFSGVINLFIMLPRLICLIVAVAFTGSSIAARILLIAAFGWSGTARAVRAKALRIKHAPFVESCSVLGYNRAHIALRHVIPNLSDVILAKLFVGVNSCIMMESTLGFLGIGDLYNPTWGTMINLAYKRGAFLRHAYNYLLVPGLCISLLALAFYLISLFFKKSDEE